MIRYFLDIDNRWRAHADYAVRLLLDGIGLRCRPAATADEAEIVYGNRPPTQDRPVLWIKADNICDWNSPDVSLRHCDGLALLCQQPRTNQCPKQECHIPFDLLYSTYTWATGVLEQRLPRRPWGVPLVMHCPGNVPPIFNRPEICHYAEYLWDRLQQTLVAPFEPLPRWPDGKRFAIVLSHDVDVPLYWSGCRHYLAKSARYACRGELHLALRTAAASLKRVPMLWQRLISEDSDDPNLRFDDWMHVGRRLGASSAFYVSVVPALQRGAAAEDVPYDYRTPAIRDAIRRCRDAGFEIGLHASVNAKRSASSLRQEKQRLEELVNGPVTGVRHHYLAVDPDNAEETLELHAQAGFEYDSTLGFSDVPGFRRGVAWPFRPFHPRLGRSIDLWELPLTIMDTTCLDAARNAESAGQILREHIESVARVGGAVVLNWHLENLNPRRAGGIGPVLLETLTDLTDDDRIWWAGPRELIRWWQERQALLSEPEENVFRSRFAEAAA